MLMMLSIYIFLFPLTKVPIKSISLGYFAAVIASFSACFKLYGIGNLGKAAIEVRRDRSIYAVRLETMFYISNSTELGFPRCFTLALSRSSVTYVSSRLKSTPSTSLENLDRNVTWLPRDVLWLEREAHSSASLIVDNHLRVQG